MKLKDILLASLLPAVLLSACAVEPETETYASMDRVMQAWMRSYYPGVSTFDTTGLYILDMEAGRGPAVSDSAYVWVHYVKSDLDGDILSTNHQSLSEQLGTYAVSNYYGSDIWRVDQGYLPNDLEALIKTMKSGSRAKVALPLSASSHPSSKYNAFSSTIESTNEIIELAIDTVMTDVYAYQEKVMREWFHRNFQVADTVAEHLYFKKLVETDSETDSIPEGNSVNVRYIGRLLNGQVFDTNIEDTAKFYRIWDSDNTYDALSISFYKDDDSLFDDNNSVVTGFGKAVQKMNFGEKAVTVFGPQLGYGEAGSKSSIPEYAPLYFWLYIEPRD